MKLLVQSDDYGITRAQAAGAIHGIRNGIIRNTGMFTNMPWSSEAGEWIYPYLDTVALGIDLNASTGSALLPHETIPSLTHPDGSFLTSRENRALDREENNYDHVVYEEVYAEFEAQTRRFIELIGRVPDYFHEHAYATATTMKAVDDLARKYRRPHAQYIMQQKYGRHYEKMDWLKLGSADDQLKSDLKGRILTEGENWLKQDVIYLVTHCGFCDSELVSLSSFNVLRMTDLAALTSPEVLNWVRDNDVELITFREMIENENQ